MLWGDNDDGECDERRWCGFIPTAEAVVREREWEGEWEEEEGEGEGAGAGVATVIFLICRSRIGRTTINLHCYQRERERTERENRERERTERERERERERVWVGACERVNLRVCGYIKMKNPNMLKTDQRVDSWLSALAIDTTSASKIHALTLLI